MEKVRRFLVALLIVAIIAGLLIVVGCSGGVYWLVTSSTMTLTPMPTTEVLNNVSVIVSVCNNNVVYPATMKVQYAGIVKLDLVQALSNSLDGLYRVCPLGYENYAECWYVPAMSVAWQWVDCAIPSLEP